MNRSVFLGVFAMATSGWCQVAVYPEVNETNFPRGIYKDSQGSMPYRYFVPPGFDTGRTDAKYPLVVYLHGNGEKGTDNNSQLNNHANGSMIFLVGGELDYLNKYPCFWLAPQAEEARHPGQIEGLVKDFLKKYPIDPDRIYLTGVSGGGAFVMDVLRSNPRRYAAAAPICGWGTDFERRHKRVPIWVFHCADDPTVPVKASDDIVERLKKAGGKPIYTRYDTGGHGGSWLNGSQGAYHPSTWLVPWMMAQKRGENSGAD